VLLYLARQLGATPDDIDDVINKKSGLLGVSGVSSDMRDVQTAAAEGNSRARLAVAIFCYRIKKYIGAYAAAMGGLDAVVFTGGIGENDAAVRAAVCDKMEVVGIQLDKVKNETLKGPADISTSAGRAHIFLVPTNEERMIARETVQVVGGQ